MGDIVIQDGERFMVGPRGRLLKLQQLEQTAPAAVVRPPRPRASQEGRITARQQQIRSRPLAGRGGVTAGDVKQEVRVKRSKAAEEREKKMRGGGGGGLRRLRNGRGRL